MAVDPSRLAPLPLFADASESEIAEAAAHFSERHAEAGTHLSNEGGAGYFFFVIESGTADVSHDDAVVATLGAGDFFGEAAVLATTRRTATVTAGRYVLTSPLGQPPNFAGTTSLDLTDLRRAG